MKPNALSQSFFHPLGNIYVGSVAPTEIPSRKIQNGITYGSDLSIGVSAITNICSLFTNN